MSIRPVAVLGCGPAGLLAAHTLALLGRPVALFSNNPAKSQISGAQFLHKKVPELCDDEPDEVITYRLRGDAATYRQKVYGEGTGPMLPGTVSFEHIEDGQTQPAWNLMKIYDRLWDSWGKGVNDAYIGSDWLEQRRHEFDFVVSSIPLPAICRFENPLKDEDGNFIMPPAAHNFSSQKIWLIDRSIVPLEDNTILYSGDLSQSWYRTSNLFGHGGTEWSTIGRHGPPPVDGLKGGIKPVANTCDCWSDVVRVGRFGEWKKGVLTHHAIRKVYDRANQI